MQQLHELKNTTKNGHFTTDSASKYKESMKNVKSPHTDSKSDLRTYNCGFSGKAASNVDVSRALDSYVTASIVLLSTRCIF